MNFQDYFPIWNKLTTAQQELMAQAVSLRSVKKGEIIHSGDDCTGLYLVKAGQLRAYILSDEGREITIYRLFDRDICLFSASCMIQSIQFDIIIEAEKDTSLWLIPVYVYKNIMAESAPVAIFTNELMASRLSDVMWLIEQILWRSLDKRISTFLLEEASIEQSNILKITHEDIANHIGTHREVVTRMLKYFQNENMVKLSRGTIEITNSDRLEKINEA